MFIFNLNVTGRPAGRLAKVLPRARLRLPALSETAVFRGVLLLLVTEPVKFREMKLTFNAEEREATVFTLTS